MKKKNILTLLGSLLAPLFCVVLLTLAILLIVTLFEKKNIHVPGSREMWIGLLGSLLGGAFTLIGVTFTINYQSEKENRIRRLENMPILKIEITTSSLKHYGGKDIYTIYDNKLYTTGFPDDKNKPYPVVIISLSNDNPAFDLCLESCIIENFNKEVTKTDAYFPEKYRLVSDEEIKTMFWIRDYDTYDTSNILGVLRISYSDLFGNKYYQDVPFSYDENAIDEYKMEVFDIRKPICVNENDIPLDYVVKEVHDYLHANI